MDIGYVTPELEFRRWACRRGELDTLRFDFSGDVETLASLRRIHVVAFDVENRKGPFCATVPQQILDAGLVAPSRCQGQLLRRAQQENTARRQVARRRVLAVERHSRNRLPRISDAARHGLPACGVWETNPAHAVDVGGCSIELEGIVAKTADQREVLRDLQPVFEIDRDTVDRSRLPSAGHSSHGWD